MATYPYRQDAGLEFLQLCSDAELKELAETLTHDEGKLRTFEKLTTEPRFKATQRSGSYKKVWSIIAAEIQRTGSDSIASAWRGHGDVYQNILIEVLKTFRVQHNSASTLIESEERLLKKLLGDAIEKMTAEERQRVAGEIGIDLRRAAPGALMAALIGGVHGAGFAAYQAAVIAAKIISKAVLGRGLAFAANAAITRSLAIFAGPVGWTLSLATLLPVATGMNMKISSRAVIHVACLRLQCLKKAETFLDET